MPTDFPRAFRPGPIEPVVDPGQHLLVLDRGTYYLYYAAFIEQVPLSHPLVANLGVLAAGATSAIFNTQTLLDMQDGELAQFRARVLDDFHVTMLQPQAETRGVTKNISATINAFQARRDPCDHLSEFFILEDDRLFMRAVNPTGYALAQTYVSFYGFRYILAGPEGVAPRGQHATPIATYRTIGDAVKAGQKFTVIPVGGWGR